MELFFPLIALAVACGAAAAFSFIGKSHRLASLPGLLAVIVIGVAPALVVISGPYRAAALGEASHAGDPDDFVSRAKRLPGGEVSRLWRVASRGFPPSTTPGVARPR
jgi:hypothetical protein